jgi:L-asparaginase II
VAAVDGSVVEESVPGAGGLAIFARSATKPFQALPAVQSAVLERFGFDDRHLALGCSSHGGAERHTQLVAGMLAACGLTEGDLGCGPLEPRDPAAAAELRAAGGGPSRLTNNCSGKHALALALSVAEGWPAEGYLTPAHQVQRGMRDAVGKAGGTAPDDLSAGTDGCGMCTFRYSLSALATAFGRLASGRLGPSGDRIAAAMRAHPDLVAFDGAVDTELMRAETGLVAKVGAEGVIGIGLADGRGFALKVRDGAMRALDPAAVAGARAVLGVAADSEALERLAYPPVLNSLGDPVGHGLAHL